ncbi:MAG: FixH family protein [Thermoanaerobaculales bacterium]
MKAKVVIPMIIGGALAVHAVGLLLVAYLTSSNPSHAIEENYYAKALAWDSKRAQDATNSDLGWKLGFAAFPPATPGEDATLEARLHDAHGAPIDGATVSVEAFHNANAGHILRARLEAAGDGIYRAALPMKHNGRWELRFTVTRGKDRFTHTATPHLFVEPSR